jgi:[FeFe] hydrogenase H-cluster maturation GTPase HydF
MQTAPRSLRLHIGIFGRTNVGKSSLLNLVAGQDVSITSARPGTTTDIVEKPMELLPIGPVVFLDTGGLGDETALGAARAARAHRAFDRTDVALLVVTAGTWDAYERMVVDACRARSIPVIGVINQCDRAAPDAAFTARLKASCDGMLTCTAVDPAGRETVLDTLKAAILAVCPDACVPAPPLVADLVKPGGVAVLIVPIDLQAPKGRLILPQVSVIRECLDHDAMALTVKEREYRRLLEILGQPPDIVICDSQVVLKMVADTPPDVPCTTFSILFARLKGDLRQCAAGAARLDALRDGDRILIGESCSHHALEDDIGRVKIPRWIRQYTGADLQCDVHAGRDFPDTLADYALVVQCGGCMQNRREMLSRIQRARAAGVPITNYGICIAKTQGVLERVLSPFPAALDAYRAGSSLEKGASHD